MHHPSMAHLQYIIYIYIYVSVGSSIYSLCVQNGLQALVETPLHRPGSQVLRATNSGNTVMLGLCTFNLEPGLWTATTNDMIYQCLVGNEEWRPGGVSLLYIYFKHWLIVIYNYITFIIYELCDFFGLLNLAASWDLRLTVRHLKSVSSGWM